MVYADTIKYDKYVKPPLGIEPKFIWKEKRIQEIKEAIERYYNANIKIPIKWIEEYNEIIEEMQYEKHDRKIW